MSENLAAIQAKFSNESNANIFAKDAAPSICKRLFVDTVRAHLSQVQLALSLKLVCNFTVPEENTCMDKTHWVLIEAIAKKLADLSGKGVTTIIGAGFSVVAVEKVGVAKKSHLSTGGPASLELLEGKVLADVALDEAVATVAA
ncbi:unnamed protein product [Sphagnum balticum]